MDGLKKRRQRPSNRPDLVFYLPKTNPVSLPCHAYSETLTIIQSEPVLVLLLRFERPPPPSNNPWRILGFVWIGDGNRPVGRNLGTAWDLFPVYNRRRELQVGGGHGDGPHPAAFSLYRLTLPLLGCLACVRLGRRRWWVVVLLLCLLRPVSLSWLSPVCLRHGLSPLLWWRLALWCFASADFTHGFRVAIRHI